MSTCVIANLGSEWLQSEVESLSDINNGLCADFANAVAKIDGTYYIIGVYDLEDLNVLLGGYSPEFECAVSQGDIGHTALYREGKYYDAECSSGVTRFEKLPINIRALAEVQLNVKKR